MTKLHATLVLHVDDEEFNKFTIMIIIIIIILLKT